MNNIKATLDNIPLWVKIIVLLFIANGLFIASVGPSWYGEDESSHFGYIEALARNDAWYSFTDNYASIDMRLADALMTSTKEPQWALELLQKSEFKKYRNYASHHKNATAYQAPLFYFAFSKVYAQLDGVSIVTILYLFRYLNVAIGACYVILIYLLSRYLLKTHEEQLLMTSFVGLLPLLALLSATVTVQVAVFLLFGVIYAGLLAAKNQAIIGYGIAIIATLGGLLMQQAFFAAPIAILGVLLLDVITKNRNHKQVLVVIICLVLGAVIVAPQLYQRHTETRYTLAKGQAEAKRFTPYTYIPTQWTRLRSELIEGFWDQRRSFVPYYSSQKAKNGLIILSVIAATGFIHWLFTVPKKSSRDIRWLVIASTTTACFFAGHLWFDYQHTQYSGQEYFKARYMYPLLPFISWSWAKGLYHFFNRSKWLQAVVLTSLILLSIAQGGAISWLTLTIGSN